LLSDFATPQSYQDIYGHAKQGKKTFLKGDSYNLGPEADSGIVSQRDPAKHRETRKSLSHAFSAKALRLQADVVLHYVNLWIQQIARLGNTDEGINVEEVSCRITIFAKQA
jgi:cytochrome P450